MIIDGPGIGGRGVVVGARSPAVSGRGFWARAGLFGRCSSIREVPEKCFIILGYHLIIASQYIYSVCFETMIEGCSGQLSPYKQHDATVDVSSSDEFLITEDPVRKGRIDREPFSKGIGLVFSVEIFLDDRNGHVMGGHTTIYIHRVGKAQLRIFIHSRNRNRGQLDKVGVKSSIPACPVHSLS